jgi:hypothetical protein
VTDPTRSLVRRDDFDELQRSHEDLTSRVETLEKRSKNLLGVLDTLKDFPAQQQQIQSYIESAKIQQITNVVGNLQTAAFGDSGSIFTTNNLLLAGNQLFWILLDPLLRRFGVISGSSPSIITWLAPIGSVITGQLTLANRQHVRFVSGVSLVRPGGSTLEVLRSRIADGSWEDFQRRTDVPATAVVLDRPNQRASAEVNDGVLRLAVVSGGATDILLATGVKAPVRVAWMIDTGLGRG